MPSVREQGLAAVDAGDHVAVRRLWATVHEPLATWWRPRQGCTLQELRPYLDLLGDEDPDEIVAAIREIAGEFRPNPGEIAARLRAGRGETKRVDTGRGGDPTEKPEALRAVVEAYRAGERACSCEWRQVHWRRDPRSVLRCRECGGLMLGQLYAAEDAGLLDLEAGGS